MIMCTQSSDVFRTLSNMRVFFAKVSGEKPLIIFDESFSFEYIQNTYE